MKVEDWGKVDFRGLKVLRDGIYLLSRKLGGIVVGAGQWGLGVSVNSFSTNGAMRFDTEESAEKFVRSHYAIPIGENLRDAYVVFNGLPDLSSHKLWADSTSHYKGEPWGPLPGSFT